MKRVVFLTECDRIPNFLTHPIRRNLSPLREMGYDFRLLYPSAQEAYGQVYESDILCVSSKVFKAEWHQPERIFEFFSRQRATNSKIIFFDEADGTGITSFELFPHIDLYLKKQLLKDRSHYQRQVYSDRLYGEFYHREFDISDPTPLSSKPIDPQYLDRVHVSWHIGLGNMAADIFAPYLRFLYHRLPPFYYSGFTRPTRRRPLDFLFLGNPHYKKRPTVSFHRETMMNRFSSLPKGRGMIAGQKKVSTWKYIQSFRKSKVSVSPFGWGEIGVRDFETWIYGAALLKPDMSHLETWPNVFLEGKTYAPIRWDFSNLEETVESLLSDEQKRMELAWEGQRTYKRMVSKEGMELFREHLVRQIER